MRATATACRTQPCEAGYTGTIANSWNAMSPSDEGHRPRQPLTERCNCSRERPRRSPGRATTCAPRRTRRPKSGSTTCDHLLAHCVASTCEEQTVGSWSPAGIDNAADEEECVVRHSELVAQTA